MIRKEKKITADLIVRIVEIIISLTILAVIIAAFLNIESDSSITGCKRLEDSVRHAVVSCYAIEGVYPPDIEYLTDHYGLQIDENKYRVRYDVFAENIMPDITLTKKQ